MAAQRKNPQIENVVMMLPSSIRCTACSTVMAKRTKVNSRKEEALGEVFRALVFSNSSGLNFMSHHYLPEFWEVWKDHTFRFCFNCTQCSAEIVLRTGPQYSHLAVEAGASKFYRYIPWLSPMVEEKEKLVPLHRPKLAREKRGGLS